MFSQEKAKKKFKTKGQTPYKDSNLGWDIKKGKLVMFSGIMNANCLEAIYEAGLLPFIRGNFTETEGHRLYQDNDLKHSSKHIEDFFEEKKINWWYTRPESPDLNPIELVWGSLKQYLRSQYKPKNLEEVKAGIEKFWHSLTTQVCQKYISHLRKVIPKVIEVQGAPSGY